MAEFFVRRSNFELILILVVEKREDIQSNFLRSKKMFFCFSISIFLMKTFHDKIGREPQTTFRHENFLCSNSLCLRRRVEVYYVVDKNMIYNHFSIS